MSSPNYLAPQFKIIHICFIEILASFFVYQQKNTSGKL